MLTVAPAGAGTSSARHGTLELSHRVDTSKAAYREGSISYLSLRRGGRLVARRRGSGPVRTSLHPRAGLYRVVSFQRPCDGNCATLDPPTDRCSKRVRVYGGETSVVRAVTKPGDGCRLRVSEPAPFPEARRVRAARAYVRGRATSSLAVIDTHGRLRGFQPHRRFVTASVVKAMLLVARLRQLGNHLPSASDRAVLEPMIQRSDNRAADAAYGWVGDGGLIDVGRRARMGDLVVPGGHWGNLQFSAADQAGFFLNVDRLVPRRSRAYALHLLSSIVRHQRWGFSRVSLRHGWHTFFKGGWRTTSLGALVHEAALFERRGRRFAMVVLSDGNPSHDYGTETLRGVAARVFK